MHSYIQCNSSNPTQTTFPKYLGQRLTSNDIGKKFIRIYPMDFRGMRDWSFVPRSHNLYNVVKAQCQLQNISPNGDFQFLKYATFYSSNLILDNLEAKDNDGLWALVEKIVDFVKKEEADEIKRHPNCPDRTSYPKYLGRELTSNDIGRLFVRIYPYVDGDWSYIPRGETPEEVTKAELKLIDILPDGKLLFFREHKFFSSKPELYNDKFWSPAEKVAAYFEEKNQKEAKEREKLRQENEAPDFTSDKPWKILGLSADENDIDTINKKFRELAFKYHPERKPHGDEEKFKILTAARDRLLKNT